MSGFLTFIVIVILLTIATYLYFVQKKKNLDLFLKSTCPSCDATKTVFHTPENEKVYFNPIEQKLIKNHGCSGVKEVEFRCKKCDFHQIHTLPNRGCGL